MKHPARLALMALCLPLAACSVLEGDKIDYKSASKAPTLEIPPDLTQLARENRYAMPGGVVTASGQQAIRPSAGATAAIASTSDVRIERQGNQRWLVVNRPADQLWGPLREFWQDNGFLLTIDQPQLGIMETDWAENRAKLPQDFVRSTLGRVFDSLYSTSERDRFRTRLERAPSGATEIFISHRGVQEVVTRDQRDTNTIWQPRPTDPELEIEFLRRLMLKLGLPQEQAQAAVANVAPAKTTSRVSKVGDVPVVLIDEGFDRAWRRVGLSLDRTGFTVEDRDRAQGTYFVRYVALNPDRQEKGFFGRLFSFGSSDKDATTVKYRITVRSQGDSSTVSVLNANGAPETSATAQRIVQLLADDLK